MTTPLEIAKAITRDYQGTPPIACYRIGSSHSERYSMTLDSNVVGIEAESAAAAVFAAAHAVAGIKSGHIGEWVGRQEPALPLRPLWIHGDLRLLLSDVVSIVLPSTALHLSEQWVFSFSRRLYEWGFNAVILGGHENVEVTGSQQIAPQELVALITCFQRLGVQVIIKPDVILPEALPPCPLDTNYAAWLRRAIAALPVADGCLWSSTFSDRRFHESAPEATQQEIALAEARLIEEALGDVPLIYLLPKGERQAPWLLEFIDDLAPATLFAFHAHDGDDWHPLWELLRQVPDVSAATFLPLTPLVGPEAPDLSLERLEEVVMRCWRHHFSGVVLLAQQEPEVGSSGDATLWVGGQRLWGGRSTSLLLESWRRCFS